MRKQSGGERDRIVHEGMIPPVGSSCPLHQTVGRASNDGEHSNLFPVSHPTDSVR